MTWSPGSRPVSLSGPTRGLTLGSPWPSNFRAGLSPSGDSRDSRDLPDLGARSSSSADRVRRRGPRGHVMVPSPAATTQPMSLCEQGWTWAWSQSLGLRPCPCSLFCEMGTFHTSIHHTDLGYTQLRAFSPPPVPAPFLSPGKSRQVPAIHRKGAVGQGGEAWGQC